MKRSERPRAGIGFKGFAVFAAIGGVLVASACSPKSGDGGAGSGGAPGAGGQTGTGSTGSESGGSIGTTGGSTGAGGAGAFGSGGDGAGGFLGAGGDGTGGTNVGSGGAATGGVSGTVTDAGANNYILPGNVCARIATIQCASEQKCCPPGSLDRTFDACVSAQATACGKIFLDQISEDASSGYDPSKAEPIFAEFERRTQACDVGVAAWAASLAGLRGITPGTKSGSCNPSSSVPLPNGPVDAIALTSCDSSKNTACLPNGLFNEAWTCQAPSAADGPCYTDVNCSDGLYCNISSVNTAALSQGHCVSRLTDGGQCASGNQCTSLYCVDGSCAQAPVTPQIAYCLDKT